MSRTRPRVHHCRCLSNTRTFAPHRLLTTSTPSSFISSTPSSCRLFCRLYRALAALNAPHGMSTVSTIQNVNTLNKSQTASATNANTAPRQRRTNNRIQSTLIQRDRGHDDGRKNSYELDKLCDALNLSGHVVIEGNFAVMLGGSANVWRGTYNGQCVAVKVIRDYARSASVETLKRVSHFVRCLELGLAWLQRDESGLLQCILPWQYLSDVRTGTFHTLIHVHSTHTSK